VEIDKPAALAAHGVFSQLGNIGFSAIGAKFEFRVAEQIIVLAAPGQFLNIPSESQWILEISGVPLPPEVRKTFPNHPHPLPPPSRRRELLIHFNMFTLSPAGRGEGEGIFKLLTPSLIRRRRRGCLSGTFYPTPRLIFQYFDFPAAHFFLSGKENSRL